MFPYWALFSVFLVGALSSRQRAQPMAGERAQLPLLLLFGCILLVAMIGFRFSVGGDWLAYQHMFRWTGHADLGEVLSRPDPGYYFFNWIAQGAGGDVWLVNLLCGLITVWGIAALAKRQPFPWVAALVAIPYLVVVVAMGYTRQAAALGFVMIGLAGLLRHGSVLRYALWIVLAALFHKTAVVALPLVAFVLPTGRLVNFMLLSAASVGLYFAFLDDHLEGLVTNYLETGYSSSGALIRISMCVVPAGVFFLFRGRLGFTSVEQRLWRNFSIVATLALLAYLVSPSSTAVDRVALYLLPMQFVILSRIPGNLLEPNFGKLLVALYCAAVLWVWLTYAVHAQAWIPYRFWWDQA